MNMDEMQAVYRLLLAIEVAREPVRFTIALPPVHGELDDKQDAAARIHRERAAELNDAMAGVRALLLGRGGVA